MWILRKWQNDLPKLKIHDPVTNSLPKTFRSRSKKGVHSYLGWWDKIKTDPNNRSTLPSDKVHHLKFMTFWLSFMNFAYNICSKCLKVMYYVKGGLVQFGGIKVKKMSAFQNEFSFIMGVFILVNTKNRNFQGHAVFVRWSIILSSVLVKEIWKNPQSHFRETAKKTLKTLNKGVFPLF